MTFKIDGQDALSQSDRAIAALETQISGLKGKLDEANKAKALHIQIAAEWEERFNQLAALKEDVKPWEPLPKHDAKSEDHRGVVLVNWSDWHVGEVIDARLVHGKNKFCPEIAAARAQKCADRTVTLWRHVRRSYAVDTLVLFLGGDFITGYLHEELAQTNAMGPVEEGLFAKRLLSMAMERLIAEKSIKTIRIVAMRGNHGRTTKKMQFKNDWETSMETWIYADLEARYGSNRVSFAVPKGDVFVAPITNDFHVRFFHGHQVRYKDGVGGVSIPLNKWLAKQQKIEPAHYNLMGHWHTLSNPTADCALNGSLKGFDEFAASAGFTYQPPLQTFELLDVGRKLIAQKLPIFCE